MINVEVGDGKRPRNKMDPVDAAWYPRVEDHADRGSRNEKEVQQGQRMKAPLCTEI